MKKVHSSLKRELGIVQLFCIASGAMISSGLFVLPGLAFAKAGPGMLLSYLIASFLMIPALLSKAELVTAMPKSGGNYFFVERSLGPLFGTIAGLMDWFSVALKTAFAMVGIGGILLLFFPHWGMTGLKIAALSATLFFMVLNLVSVKGSSTFQVVLVFALLAILGLVVVKGFPTVHVRQFEPFNPGGWGAIFAVSGMVFVSFGGLTKVTAVAEEAKNPGRNIPLSMFLAFTIISLVYLLVVYVTIGTVPAEQIAGALTPVALGAENTMGIFGKVVVTMGAAFAFATTGNAGIMAASRSPMAMSRDGLLPEFFAVTQKRFGTPVRSIIVTSMFIVTVLLFLSIESLVKTASTMMILMFALVKLSVIIMRRSRIEGYRPTFRSPFVPYIQIMAIGVYGFLIVKMGTVPIVFTGGFILFALVWYLLYVQRRINNESALVYMVKKITNHHFERTQIENELRTISLERDSIEFDRFDHLVKEGIVMDIKESITARELFEKVATKLAPKVDEDPDALFELFLERERISSTVIAPGLAIPHIIIEGDSLFHVVLVRAREGVVFSDLSEPVHTMFVLAGSMDERNFHLRALMNIANIFQEEGFERRFMEARNKEQLRDVILLSSRKRGFGLER